MSIGFIILILVSCILAMNPLAVANEFNAISNDTKKMRLEQKESAKEKENLVKNLTEAPVKQAKKSLNHNNTVELHQIPSTTPT